MGGIRAVLYTSDCTGTLLLWNRVRQAARCTSICHILSCCKLVRGSDCSGFIGKEKLCGQEKIHRMTWQLNIISNGIK